MPRNVEIKAYANNMEKLKNTVENLSQSGGEMLRQEDIFFCVPNGRLKLRQIQETLGRAVGILGTVRKDRCLHLVGQTRIHLDNVENLGDFVELEVLLTDDQTAEDGRTIAEDLMQRLDIGTGDLIHVAYMDLILQKS